MAIETDNLPLDLDAEVDDNTIEYSGNPKKLKIKQPYNAQVPIGAILPWLKNLSGTPTLPNGFVECNGQLITDPQSPYYNTYAPNLNTNYTILYGNNTSGQTKQENYTPTHTHTTDPHTHGYYGANYGDSTGIIDFQLGNGSFGDQPFSGAIMNATVTVNNTTNGQPFNGYSVVWILRIK